MVKKKCKSSITETGKFTVVCISVTNFESYLAKNGYWSWMHRDAQHSCKTFFYCQTFCLSWRRFRDKNTLNFNFTNFTPEVDVINMNRKLYASLLSVTGLSVCWMSCAWSILRLTFCGCWFNNNNNNDVDVDEHDFLYCLASPTVSVLCLKVKLIQTAFAFF